MSFLPNIFGNFMEKAKESPELDKTKEALKELKGEIDVFAAFEIDMDEIKIKDPKKREENKRILQERLIAGEIENIDQFIDNFAKYTKLDKKIEECKKAKSGDPFEKWAKTIAQVSPAMAGIIGWILSFKVGEPEEGKKMSKLDTKLTKLAAILRGDEPEKEDEAKKEGESETAIAKTEEQKEKEAKDVETLAKTSKDGVKKAFEEAGLAFNEGKYNEDISYLYQNGINEPGKITAMINKAKENEIIKKFKEHLGDKTQEVKLSLADIYLFTDKLRGKQSIVIDGMTKISKNNSGAMNEYLEKAVRKFPRDNEAIARYRDEIEGADTDKA